MPEDRAEYDFPPVKSRFGAREAVYSALFAAAGMGWRANQVLDLFLAAEGTTPEAREYCTTLFKGVIEDFDLIDSVITPHLARGWTLDRIAMTDLTALRMAVFELYHVPSIPPRVTINEAVNLAKRFGTPESGKFVNGVLGAILPKSPKANWTPPAPEEVPEPTLPEVVAEDTARTEVEEFHEDAPEIVDPAEPILSWSIKEV
ncbi:MAG: transcription antitermination factor NusB [Chthonomonas sp.]|nr:transcription antitermination factor NusB [Chthonomonas sp.]